MLGPIVDLAFRPASYWDHTDPLAAVLGNMKGQVRRGMVRDFLTGLAPDELGELEEQYLPDAIDPELRTELTRLHPRWMGGEYLPDYLPGEVEIARLILASVTMDVIAIRVRRCGRRLLYRVVDEYGTGYVSRRRSSARPLTLGQLIELIESVHVADDPWASGDPFPGDILELNLEAGVHPNDLEEFIRMESYHYPELGLWWAARAAVWAESKCRELAETEAEDTE